MDDLVLGEQAGDGIVGDHPGAGLGEDVLVDGVPNDLPNICLLQPSFGGDLGERRFLADGERARDAEAGDGLLADKLVVLQSPDGRVVV